MREREGVYRGKSNSDIGAYKFIVGKHIPKCFKKIENNIDYTYGHSMKNTLSHRPRVDREANPRLPPALSCVILLLPCRRQRARLGKA
jgi:hypothetical protein